MNQDMNERVSVTFSVAEWAKVITAVGMSPLDLAVKSALNNTIFECVSRTERVLS